MTKGNDNKKFDPNSKDYFHFDYHEVQEELHERMEQIGLGHEF
jgi:hypothetical protein